MSDFLVCGSFFFCKTTVRLGLEKIRGYLHFSESFSESSAYAEC